MSIYKKRRELARTQMDLQGIDFLIVGPSSDLYYLTGYAGHATERLTALVLGRDIERFILPGFELHGLGSSLRGELEVQTWQETDSPIQLIGDLLGARAGSAAAGGRLWSEFLIGLQQRLPEWRWHQGAEVLTALRMRKDDEEIGHLRTALAKAESALGALLNRGIEGRSEREIARELALLAEEAGLDTHGGYGIVAAGPNGAAPHHQSGERIIAAGDAVVIDFGGTYNGYHADITRTPVVGKASAEFREAYEAVLRANGAAFAAVRPGEACGAIDRAGRAVIERAGYGGYFTHRLGHGIGLDVHEEPYIVSGSQVRLSPGMTFTDEPGIYIPGQFGIRIEDVVRVTGEGGEYLTSYPRELRIV